jgi:hypothetical protein
MESKNRQNLDSPTDEELTNQLLETFSTEVLVSLLKDKIMMGQANITDVIKGLMDDKEAAIVIMNRN